LRGRSNRRAIYKIRVVDRFPGAQVCQALDEEPRVSIGAHHPSSYGAHANPRFEDLGHPSPESRRPIQDRLGSVVEDSPLSFAISGLGEIFNIAANDANLGIGSLRVALLPDREDQGSRKNSDSRAGRKRQ
jgi:hypothetical protein